MINIIFGNGLEHLLTKLNNLKQMKYTENADTRFISASNKGKFTYTQELNILNHLLNKFKPESVTEYARKENIKPPAVYDRINRGKVMTLKMINRTFIFD